MTFRKILDILEQQHILIDHNITDLDRHVKGALQTDNRLLAADDIFVCIKGYTVDGHSFIPDARAHQVACVVQEHDVYGREPSIQVNNTRRATALIAKLLMSNPTSKFQLIGITGTNGKTTTSLLIFNALRNAGFNCGWIGTLGYYINDDKFVTNNTTPDIIELNSIFNQMLTANVKYVVMEVSSHALALDRVYGLDFDYCLFTNLSRDHLDFHANMDDYAAAKALLFDEVHSPRGKHLINIADKYGIELYEQLHKKRHNVFSIAGANADFQITEEDYSLSGASFSLVSQWAKLNIKSRLTGHFNILNLAMAAATLNMMGFESLLVSTLISQLDPIPGRMQSIPNVQGVGVFIDYAHTPEAIENVLRTCQNLPHKRILCLIGAGGNRDTGKRPLMLKAALAYSDAVIITDDNPRFEDPRQIIREIVEDTNLWLPWWIIRNREQAIASILRLAQCEDIVVICGKGHESYQDIKGIKQEFNDVAVASKILSYPIEPKSTQDTVLAIDPLQLEILYSLYKGHEDADAFNPDFYTSISIDSRSISSHAVYFGIQGETFDGNAFIPSILQDSSTMAVGDSADITHRNYLQIADSRDSFGMLCRKYLLMFDVYKVALTGSTGKTTTKDFIYNVISKLGSTLKTEKNENNVIGLCHTILRLKAHHRYAVLELGTNHFGEIAQLSEICFPNCGIVLNIGPSHLEFFGNEDGVFREKSALINRQLELKIFTADDPRFDSYRASGFGVGYNSDADFVISQVISDAESTSFYVNGEQYSIPYSIPYYATNAAFAIAIGQHLGISRQQIQSGLSELIPMNMRMQIERFQDSVLIIDCYNANPVSMQNAIRYWSNYETNMPHIAILGDMLELGDTAESYHEMIGAILCEFSFEALYTVGKYAMRYHPEQANCVSQHFENVELMLDSPAILNFPAPAVILLKGSHGIKLDKLIPFLKGRI